MRQRRSPLYSTTARINHHEERLSSPRVAIPTRESRNSLTSFFILVISGAVGFVVSTCTLLLVVSLYPERDSLFYGTSHLILQQPNELSPRWEWHVYYGNSRNQTRSQGNSTFTQNHLIVQISTSPYLKRHRFTASSDLQLLDITSRVNRAYAKKWRIDYAKVDFPQIDPTDKVMILPHDNVIQAEFSIENFIGINRYIRLLRHIRNIGRNLTSPDIKISTDNAISNHSESHLEHQYDLVWIFADPSTMVVDFEKWIFEHGDFLLTSLSENAAEVNVRSLDAGHHSMIAVAHSTINEGALLWNLNHQHISRLLEWWEELNHLGSALNRTERATQQRPLRNEIPDNKSIMYHNQFESGETMRTSATSYERSRHHDSERLEVNNTHEDKHAARSRGDQFLQNPPFRTIEQEEFRMRAIKLQSVADLVCFRNFPSCQLL